MDDCRLMTIARSLYLLAFGQTARMLQIVSLYCGAKVVLIIHACGRRRCSGVADLQLCRMKKRIIVEKISRVLPHFSSFCPVRQTLKRTDG